ncbi:endonuclease Q family protein [Chengkuizengella sediminis]|uniref:endonuclease Q family protein n=1 Tax=Chengkuizengella sediminis TaxID=1885917 RepID=UPI00138A50C1|nr:endonuclease Q family protein [Chengkuizengella sediminis]NDI34259.1 TIGR00375 family protein [Chengkuizengella sediminis]
MQLYYADLHIHIGRSNKGKAVKITASRDLTFYNIMEEASTRKGMDIVGIIDCQSPAVQEDILYYLNEGTMKEVDGGGIQFRNTTMMLGSEIEICDEGFGPAHVLAYLPNLQSMMDFTRWMSNYMKNVNLSTQRLYVPAKILQEEVIGRDGLFIPAHIFTPHKSAYGSCSSKLSHVFNLDFISAVELGLSSDSEMAGLISELNEIPFLTNSDAHSLGKIAREYNQLRLKSPTFSELKKALLRKDGRKITANFGLNPKLGKYNRTYCSNCSSIIEENNSVVERCTYCGSEKVVRGVFDRITQIADQKRSKNNKPPYLYQIPLEFIPGLGPSKLNQLLSRFGTEMNVLHHATREQISEVVGEKLSDLIMLAKQGKSVIQTGGGGTYGKIT